MLPSHFGIEEENKTQVYYTYDIRHIRKQNCPSYWHLTKEGEDLFLLTVAQVK